MVKNPVRIAVVGFGLIGKRHVDAILDSEGADIAAIIDPSPQAAAYAKEKGFHYFQALEECLDAKVAEGMVLATPNSLHFNQSMLCLERGMPILVEKPLTTDPDMAKVLVETAEEKNIPALVGHHRRYFPLVRKAAELVNGGAIGKPVSIQSTTWFYKPEDYFETEWRRKAGAGPLFINLIHDIDIMRFLFGDIESVLAAESDCIRNFEVEDTATVILKFKNGALGTMNISDTIPAPWSWELTSGENPVYHKTSQSCYLVGGTDASLSLPDCHIWKHEGGKSWWKPLKSEEFPVDFKQPLVSQIENFAEVIRGTAKPIAPAREGYEALRTLSAIKAAASKR